MNICIRRGDIYYADLSPVVGSEQGGVRPVLIVQNDIGNKYSPTVIAAAITSQTGKARLPTHIAVQTDGGLAKNSVILLEQIRTIDKRYCRFQDKRSARKNETPKRRLKIGGSRLGCPPYFVDAPDARTPVLRKRKTRRSTFGRRRRPAGTGAPFAWAAG